MAFKCQARHSGGGGGGIRQGCSLNTSDLGGKSTCTESTPGRREIRRQGKEAGMSPRCSTGIW